MIGWFANCIETTKTLTIGEAMEIIARRTGGRQDEDYRPCTRCGPQGQSDVVPNLNMAQSAIKRVMERSGRLYPEVTRQFISVQHPDRLRGLRPSRVYVEEVDAVLSYALGHSVDVATFTGDVDVSTQFVNPYLNYLAQS